MRLPLPLPLLLGQTLVTWAATIASRADRLACPHYQHMQCMLDISEKACEPDEEALPLLDWETTESVWLCCCPKPYTACVKGQMNKACLNSVTTYLGKDKITSRARLVEGLQRARGSLREAGGEQCSKLAPQEPLSVCGFEAVPKKRRSLDREDLFCEMLTWQWEELGDGDKAEFSQNHCAFDKRAKAGMGSEDRKNGQLAQTDL
eukprot:CAMPEP_0171065732 /NCGR_PEP_ID=MMETSP0766_2-20121228/7016_1 /TAXON_ID=439317 /ORGANISM="Gambierdiscus australes, Strain CAWD 149" /LENGTH=204 /DNA_ID=CAMNT_0011521855 /DNA_START=41 /DNA_END=655 /DNA_ORIENTATION=+